MNAEDIKKVLEKINFDWEAFLQEVSTYAITRIFQEIDADRIAGRLLDVAEKKGLLDQLEPWMIDLIESLGPDTAMTILMSLIKAEAEKYLADHDIAKMIDELIDKLLDDDEEEPEEPEDPPGPEKQIKDFKVVGSPNQLLVGHDNGVTTVGNGKIFMITGDGFVGQTKYETAIFYLDRDIGPHGIGPMGAGNWKFMRGTSGKCYGALVFKGDLLLAQSDEGSGYDGALNCRIWNVTKNRRSQKTLQSLFHNGMNWFFVQKGPDYENSYQADTVDIGCVEFATPGYAAHNKNFRTPVRMWRGDPNDVNSFKYLGKLEGVIGRRNGWGTTASLTYISEFRRYVFVLGDWTVSENQYFVSQADNVLGPYRLFKWDKFSPPMKRINVEGGQWSGVFTGNFAKDGDQWLEFLSGHRGPPADSTWIRKVVWI